MHGGIHNELPDDAAQEKEKGFGPAAPIFSRI